MTLTLGTVALAVLCRQRPSNSSNVFILTLNLPLSTFHALLGTTVTVAVPMAFVTPGDADPRDGWTGRSVSSTHVFHNLQMNLSCGFLGATVSPLVQYRVCSCSNSKLAFQAFPVRIRVWIRPAVVWSPWATLPFEDAPGYFCLFSALQDSK